MSPTPALKNSARMSSSSQSSPVVLGKIWLKKGQNNTYNTVAGHDSGPAYTLEIPRNPKKSLEPEVYFGIQVPKTHQRFQRNGATGAPWLGSSNHGVAPGLPGTAGSTTPKAVTALHLWMSCTCAKRQEQDLTAQRYSKILKAIRPLSVTQCNYIM